MKRTCEVKVAPDCLGDGEVRMICLGGRVDGIACVPCGKVFQTKFPHACADLTLFPLDVAA